MSKFTRAFANAVDSIRHEVVERGWYGREVTGNISQPEGQGGGDRFYGNSHQHNTTNNFYGVTNHQHNNDVDNFYGKGGPMPATPASEIQAPAVTAPKIEAPEIGTAPASDKAPEISAPAIEAPPIEPPASSSQPSPGY